MIAVLTAILNGYDNLRQPDPRDPNVRYVCYTDEPRFDSGWEIQPARNWNGSASHDSRLPKILSHLHADSEFSIWMDGCFCPRRPAEFAAEHLKNVDVVAFEHPRQNAYEEAAYCRREGFGDPDAIDAQLERYRADGYPGEPFVCGGIIARRESATRGFNELWWREYRAGQARDQFSLGYALWKSGVHLRMLRGIDVLQNPWFSFHFHAWAEHLSDNPQFAGQRERMRQRELELRRLTA